jgi:hypothetical protein
MGTFHQGKHELHGITVIVDTHGEEVFIGRCDDLNETGVLLEDVDIHREGDAGLSKDAYVQRAARVGVWVKERRRFVPGEAIRSVRRLGDVPVA